LEAKSDSQFSRQQTAATTTTTTVLEMSFKLNHSKSTSYKHSKQNKRNQISQRRKRVRSSDTDPEAEITLYSSDSDTEKMSNMESVPEVMSDFLDRVDCNWEEILQRLRESEIWKAMEESISSTDRDIEDLRTENKTLRKRLENTEGRLTRTEKKLQEAQEKILDLTSRSMRENLVFKNVQETKGENLDHKLRDIFKTKLKIPEAEVRGIVIERVHRIGKPSTARSRNIVAKLSPLSKSKVMVHLKNLSRDDDVKITEQFPPEINARRNKLWPQFIEAKESGKKAKFNVDKLVVDNKIISPPQDKVTDINLDVTKRSMELKPKHTGITSVDRSHFQGHIVPIQSSDDVIPAIQALCQDQRVAGSMHLMYAYRIGGENHYISNYDEDGEWGAGRELMSVLDQSGSFNHLVAVTRWYAGRNLGPTRHDQIRYTAELAVKLIQDD
jgi:hypothetical protein